MNETLEKRRNESQDTTHVQNRDYHMDVHPLQYLKHMPTGYEQPRVEEPPEDTGGGTSQEEIKYWQSVATNATRRCYWLSASNPKTLKGIKLGYVTVTLSFAPSNFSGHMVCYRDKECKDDCIYWQGRGRMHRTQNARIDKTNRYFDNPDKFAREICHELEIIQGNLAEHKLKLACRLNCFSDIRWESKVFESIGRHTILQMNPNVQFYDYTKYPWGKRDAWKKMPHNYHLTYSYNGTHDDKANCFEVLDNGHNVMVVYTKAHFQNFVTDLALGFDLLSPWGFKMINAEDTDSRFLDPSPVICVGCEKGKTKISI